MSIHNICFHGEIRKISALFGHVFKKNLFFRIVMSWQVCGQAGVGRRLRFTFWLIFFSKLYVTFILQWIAFIFGRGEEEDQ